MDILLQLNSYCSKINTKEIAYFAIENPEKIDYLIELTLSDKYPTNARAAWVLTTIMEIRKHVCEQYVDVLCNNLKKIENISVARNYLKIISNYRIKEEFHAYIVEYCFRVINDSGIPVANKIYSIDIIQNLCKIYPELAQELHVSLQENINKSTVGFKSKAKKILKKDNG